MCTRQKIHCQHMPIIHFDEDIRKEGVVLTCVFQKHRCHIFIRYIRLGHISTRP